MRRFGILYKLLTGGAQQSKVIVEKRIVHFPVLYEELIDTFEAKVPTMGDRIWIISVERDERIVKVAVRIVDEWDYGGLLQVANVVRV